MCLKTDWYFLECVRRQICGVLECFGILIVSRLLRDKSKVLVAMVQNTKFTA